MDLEVGTCVHGSVNPGRRCLAFLLVTFAISLCVIGIGASTALALSPSVETLLPSSVEATGATVRGLVNPNGAETKAYFEYGTSMSYGSKTAEVNVGSGTETLLRSASISGLNENTEYHYRIVASNSSGTSYGADQTFTTLAPVTLRYEAGGELGFEAPLKVFSSNFTFNAGSEEAHPCEETEFSGEVSENPGAIETVTTAKMQNSGGAVCFYYHSGFVTLNAKYSFPTKGMTLEFKADKAGGIVKTTSFVLVAAIYSGKFQIAECEFSTKLSGTYELETPLELALSGETELIKGTGSACFGGSLSGTFVVMSSGTPVEATR